MTESLPTPGVMVAALAAALAGGAVALASAQAAPSWQSTALLSIDEPKAVAAAADGGIIEKLGRLRYVYIGLVGTDRIATPVAIRLGLDVAQVRSRISATASPTDLLVRVTGTASSAPGAQQTAEQLAGALVDYAARQQKDDGVAPAQRVVFAIVEHAQAPTRIAPRRSRALVASLLAAAVVGGGVLLLLRRRRRRG